MAARSRLFAAGVAALLLIGWWAFPSLARDPDRLDVLIVGDGQVHEAAEPLQRRVRELGMTVELQVVDMCASAQQIADEVDRSEPSIVVISAAAADACGYDFWAGARAAARGARLIALVQPGRNEPWAHAATEVAGVEVADPTRLLGERTAGAPAPTRIACQWWDDCDPDGQVEIRDAAGALTYAGGERLARTLAGVLP